MTNCVQKTSAKWTLSVLIPCNANLGFAFQKWVFLFFVCSISSFCWHGFAMGDMYQILSQGVPIHVSIWEPKTISESMPFCKDFQLGHTCHTSDHYVSRVNSNCDEIWAWSWQSNFQLYSGYDNVLLLLIPFKVNSNVKLSTLKFIDSNPGQNTRKSENITQTLSNYTGARDINRNKTTRM